MIEFKINKCIITIILKHEYSINKVKKKRMTSFVFMDLIRLKVSQIKPLFSQNIYIITTVFPTATIDPS